MYSRVTGETETQLKDTVFMYAELFYSFTVQVKQNGWALDTTQSRDFG